MASLNVVVISGNVTRKPELRHVGSGGTAVAEVGLALNKKYKDKQSNSWKEKTTFVDVTVWSRTAEVACEYLDKGSQVEFVGELEMDEWEDKNTGSKRTKLKVVARDMNLIGGRSDSGGSGSREQPSNQGDRNQDSGGGNDSPF